ncbi:DNA adenine methylase [uncultured Gulosibacter sp.]|uniref:DNA adenine methylase n=1 Tax=uncultured Gulosibacter sp. TaxID=1339167 RepID=UPI00288B36C3|nr:DNA adenine methylase [uncultured Gulosibacter sp.]
MSQATLFELGLSDQVEPGEDPSYLTRQLVTYIGNKRGLAGPISQAVIDARSRLGGRKLRSIDLFAGSGFVARLLKKHSSLVASNDLELYAQAIGECFLADRDEALLAEAAQHADRLNRAALDGASHDGFIRELYSPVDDQDIQLGERVFYSNDNARRLDFYVQELSKLPDEIRCLLLGPLLSSASIHANTGGVFKGFYKDKNTGIGKFGAAAGDATSRILSPITLEAPVQSVFRSEHKVFRRDANDLAPDLGSFDLVYIDPPYNQHPYGSNYFMLNLLANYERPEEVSRVSGIPTDWNRSGYNVKKRSLTLLTDLFEKIRARFLLVSFNSEGYVSTEEIKEVLGSHGRVDEEIFKYNTYRASRNLRGRPIHVNEHLFLLDREG